MSCPSRILRHFTFSFLLIKVDFIIKKKKESSMSHIKKQHKIYFHIVFSVAVECCRWILLECPCGKCKSFSVWNLAFKACNSECFKGGGSFCCTLCGTCNGRLVNDNFSQKRPLNLYTYTSDSYPYITEQCPYTSDSYSYTCTNHVSLLQFMFLHYWNKK